MTIPTDFKLKKVEDHLNTVKYSVDNQYIPSDFALKFVTFIKLVNGLEGEENLTPILHFKMLDTLAYEPKDTANMVHRGSGKTTVFGEYMFFYIAVYKEIPFLPNIEFAIYVSDSIDNGVKSMRKNLESRWDKSDFLKKYIPVIKFTDIRWEFINIDGKKFVVRGYGAKTGVRGTKEYGKRPKLAILDDLVSDEDARSPTVIASIEDTVYKAVNYALHPRFRKIIWCGTPFNANDPLYKAVESGAWAVNVFPVCEKFPCTEEEFMGSWPDRFEYHSIKQRYDEALLLGKVDTFNQELMLRIISDDDRLVLDSDIQWYNRDLVLTFKDAFNFYITTDFATSEKAAADFSVISVWAINSKGYIYLIDGICKRQQMDKNIDDLFVLAQKYKPQSVGVEVSGQQGGFIPWLQNEMIKRNVYFSLASNNNEGRPGIRPNTQKIARFNIVHPWLKTKMVFFPSQLANTRLLIEAMEELKLITPKGCKSKHDDWLDTFSMLGSMYLWKPAENESEDINDQGLWEPDKTNSASSRRSNYIV